MFERIISLDTQIAYSLYDVRQPLLVTLLFAVTLLGSPEVVLSVTAVCTVVWWLRNKVHYIAALWTGLVCSTICFYFGKIFFQRTRPVDIGVYVESSFSFPSAHATIAVVLYGFITYTLWLNTKDQLQRNLIVFTGVCITLAIGFSRMYLGVHFLSDVIAGFVLGFFWLLVMIRIQARFHLSRP